VRRLRVTLWCCLEVLPGGGGHPWPLFWKAGSPCGACRHPENYVIRINDGDTIQDQVKRRPKTVRLLGVDTPEIRDPRKPFEYVGREASRFTASVLKIIGVGFSFR